MEILLVNPNSRKHDSVDEIPLITPPINLMYIAQSLVNQGYKTKIIDAFALNLNKKQLIDQIKKSSPFIIGIPLYSNDLTIVYELIENIKNIDKSIKIFLAGPHASTMPIPVMKQFSNVEYLVRGEGEITTPKLIELIEKDKSIENLQGISFRTKKNKIKHNPDSKPISNLDEISIPSRKFIDSKQYYSKMSKREKTDVVITSRGCPFKCTFCAKLTPYFRNYRQRSVSNVVKELKVIDEVGTSAVEIYDELFTYNKKWVYDFVKQIEKEKLDFEFRIRTRVSSVDNNLLKNLKKVGCSTISYGVESGNQNILNNIRKGTNINQIKKAFSLTEKYKINILGFFMLGNRGDTPQTIRQTIDFAKKLNPLFATFGVLQPYPGTIDYNYAKEKGILQGDYAPFKPKPWIKLPWMNGLEDLNGLSRKAYQEYYWRPKYINKFLISTISQKNFNLLKYAIKNSYKRISRLNFI